MSHIFKYFLNNYFLKNKYILSVSYTHLDVYKRQIINGKTQFAVHHMRNITILRLSMLESQ